METVKEKLVKLIKEIAKEEHICLHCEKDKKGENVGFICENCRFAEKGCVEADIAERLIQNGVTIHEWVSVDERLPDDELDKLVYLSSCRITIANYNDHVLPHAREPIGWGYDCKNGYINFWKECVTHWMPLPALPQPPKEVQ